MTISGVLIRGLRPKITMMSQNSHWNGQPRDVCTQPIVYSLNLTRSYRGIGTLAMSVFSACS